MKHTSELDIIVAVALEKVCQFDFHQWTRWPVHELRLTQLKAPENEVRIEMNTLICFWDSCTVVRSKEPRCNIAFHCCLVYGVGAGSQHF